MTLPPVPAGVLPKKPVEVVNAVLTGALDVSQLAGLGYVKLGMICFIKMCTTVEAAARAWGGRTSGTKEAAQGMVHDEPPAR